MFACLITCPASPVCQRASWTPPALPVPLPTCSPCLPMACPASPVCQRASWNTSGLTGSPCRNMFRAACYKACPASPSSPAQRASWNTSGPYRFPLPRHVQLCLPVTCPASPVCPEGFMEHLRPYRFPLRMFSACLPNMSGVTLPSRGLSWNTSGLTGSPAAYHVHYACHNMSGVTYLPDGFMEHPSGPVPPLPHTCSTRLPIRQSPIPMSSTSLPTSH